MKIALGFFLEINECRIYINYLILTTNLNVENYMTKLKKNCRSFFYKIMNYLIQNNLCKSKKS